MLIDCQSNTRHLLAWLMGRLDPDKDGLFLAVTRAVDKTTGTVRGGPASARRGQPAPASPGPTASCGEEASDGSGMGALRCGAAQDVLRRGLAFPAAGARGGERARPALARLPLFPWRRSRTPRSA